MSLRDFAEDVNISTGSVDAILTDALGLKLLSAKRGMLEWMNNGPTFITFIIGDETWVYEFDLWTKQQAIEWRAPNWTRLTKIRQIPSKPRFCSLISWSIVHHDVFPERGTFYYEDYLQVMCRLREAILQKRSGLLGNNNRVFTTITHLVL